MAKATFQIQRERNGKMVNFGRPMANRIDADRKSGNLATRTRIYHRVLASYGIISGEARGEKAVAASDARINARRMWGER